MLLKFLQYDQQEALKVGFVVDSFVEDFSRKFGEEARDCAIRLEYKIKEMDETTGEPLNAHLEAHYWPKKLKVSGEKQSQIITGAENRMVYEDLIESAKACVPRVSMLRGKNDEKPSGSGDGSFHSRRGGRYTKRNHGHRVHEATHEGDEGEDDEHYGDDSGAAEQNIEEGAEVPDPPTSYCSLELDWLPEVLARGVEESQVVLTQAKKFRSDIEKAREVYRKPGGTQPRNASRCSRCACRARDAARPGTGRTIQSARATRADRDRNQALARADPRRPSW